MSDAVKLARAALDDNWAPNIRDVAQSLARAVIDQAAELDRLRAVFAQAQHVRRGCYSIKSKLMPADRRLFDAFNVAVDEATFGKAGT